MKRLLTAMVCVWVSSVLFAAQPARFLSEPDIHGDTVVFCYEGDLWTVSTTGGEAVRLTSYPGNESHPIFSPDGNWIAFSASYDGGQALYKMPAAGGEPVRLTFNGGGATPVAWTPDGERVVFTSFMKTFIYRDPKLFSIKADGTAPEQLPVDRGVLVGFNADGSEMLYCRKGMPEYQWKRYRGGRYVDIWRYNFKTGAFTAITDFVGKNAYPMWIGDSMYFVSDRGADKISNLYKKNLETGSVEAVTGYENLDVMMAETDGKQIVYVQDGFLHVLNTGDGTIADLTVTVPSDRWRVRNRIINPKDYIHSMDVSSDGEQAVFEARGDIIVVDTDKDAQANNLSNSAGTRERLPKVSPDGDSVCFFSDKSGEYQLYKQSIQGGPWLQLTDGDYKFPYRPVWSPDGKRILFGTKDFAIYVVDVAGKKTTRVDAYHQLKNDEFSWEIDDYGWAPDSDWLCYSTVAENKNSVIRLYRVSDGKRVAVTDDFYDNLYPRFDANGDYLYFASSRNFDIQMDFYEDNHVVMTPYQVVAVQLQAGQKPPFMDADEEAKKDKDEEAPFVIDVKGLSDRMFPLPVDAGNVFYLKAGKGKVAWFSAERFTEDLYDVVFKPGRRTSMTLNIFDMATEKLVQMEGKYNDFRLSADGSTMIVRQRGDYKVTGLDKAFGSKKAGDTVSLNKMTYQVDSYAEFNQIFNDTWRWWRDFFYDANHHGNDWQALGDQYRAWIPYLSSRQDLNWLLSQMVGEVCVGHAYIGGGDSNGMREPSQNAGLFTGYLGADLEPDHKANRYRFGTVFGPTKYNLDVTGPLSRPDMDVKTGDYLIAIDGNDIQADDNYFKHLQVVRGQKIDVTVSDKPDGSTPRTYTVEPARSERNLRYVHWLAGNIETVLEKTGGKVGYMHINNMSDTGIAEFDKFWRAFRYKDGIIIDMRRNSGGWTEYFLIDKLERKQVAFNVLTEMNPMRYPGAASTAKYVALSNEYNGSDGEAFIQHFKARKLGKVIGVPSWGGLVGIINGQPTLDNGYVFQPNNAFYGQEGEWWVENRGAVPDIEIDNDPASVMAGKDVQLDKAIEVILQDIAEDTREKLPPVPAYPVR